MHFSLYRTIQPLAPDAITLMSVASMRVLSHAIEDAVLSGSPGTVLSAGFQRSSFFRLQEARYRRLAQVCSSISVHALFDIPVPVIEPITYVRLAEGSPLTREWFLVVNAPDFACALIAQELDAPLSAPRRFQALFVTDGDVIDDMQTILPERADAPYEPPQVRNTILRQRNIQRVISQLIAHQETPTPASARSKQADELRELTRLLPAFAKNQDWQRFLLHTIEQRADRLAS